MLGPEGLHCSIRSKKEMGEGTGRINVYMCNRTGAQASPLPVRTVGKGRALQRNLGR